MRQIKIEHNTQPFFPSTDDPNVKDIVELLDDMCLQAGKDQYFQYCRNCGLPLDHLNITFVLWENDRAWNIPVPVCLACSANAEQLSSKQVA